jgi:threonine/homoserine/homoserine lactone efflux protein
VTGMIESLVAAPTFLAFLLASLALAITPGPGVVYIVTRTLSQGRRAGLAAVGGIALGNLGNAAAASIGLAAVLKVSAPAFLIIKFAGAAYLVFLGIKTLRGRRPMPAMECRTPVSPVALFRDGFFVALLNPKTALFFAALLPQFMIPGASALWQSLVLGCVFVSIAACTDTIYVLTASVVSSTIRPRSAWQTYGRYLSAATFFGLGLYAALANPHSTAPNGR